MMKVWMRGYTNRSEPWQVAQQTQNTLSFISHDAIMPVMKHKNKLSFTICSEYGGGYSAQCIEFPGIITQAETKTELKKMINDAVNGYFESFPEEQNRL